MDNIISDYNSISVCVLAISVWPEFAYFFAFFNRPANQPATYAAWKQGTG